MYGRFSVTGNNGGLITAISDFNRFKFRFGGMHSFSYAIITFVIEAKAQAPSPWPILLFKSPIGSFPSRPTQYALYIARAS